MPVSAVESNSETSSPDLVQTVLLVTVPLIAWGAFVSKLTSDWSTNSQYEFGYFVPFFILYLLIRRWGSRPKIASATPLRSSALLSLGILILLLPIQIIQEANPDWRPLNWVHALLVVALSLMPFAAVGGWRWARHFSAPFLLIFVALPWPLATEQAVLQGLSSAVTAVTVELLNLINIPALQRGNVIDMAAGSVGVADACSGIRSLAGTLMASIFFGEFFRLPGLKRVMLVIGACILSFGLNICRAFFLSWRAAVEGVSSIEKWHDPAGFTIFAISFAGLWMLSNIIARDEITPPLLPQEPFKLPRFSRTWILCGIVWTAAIGGISEMWYRFREGERPPSVAWGLNWPQISKSFQFTPVPDETRSILRYSSGKAASFQWGDGTAWQVFFFHWAPKRSSVQLATMHRPEVCLPAVGYKFLGEANQVEMVLPQLTLPFTGSVFDCDGQLVYVYRCLWEDHPIAGLTRNRNFDMSLSGRLRTAWYGRRNLGQRMLQVIVLGATNEDGASKQLRSRLAELIALNR